MGGACTSKNSQMPVSASRKGMSKYTFRFYIGQQDCPIPRTGFSSNNSFLTQTIKIGDLSLKSIKTTEDLSFQCYHFFNDKKGKFSKEYQVNNESMMSASYCEIKKVKEISTGIFRIAKIIEKDPKEPSNIERGFNELQSLRLLDHPNIVRILDSFKTDHYICLINEMFAGGDLASKITKFQNEE